MAVFDVLVNHSDREGAHILAIPGGHRCGLDHELTFHVDDKLRTVLWGWLGAALSEEEHDGVGRVLKGLDSKPGRQLAALPATGDAAVKAFASQPTASAVSSMPVRTSRIDPTPRAASPVISPSRGPGPRPAPM